MSDVAGEGRTVIFVSHNLDAVQRLCSQAVCSSRDRSRRSATPPRSWASICRATTCGRHPAPESTSRRSREQEPEKPGSSRSVHDGSGVDSGTPYPDGPLEFVLEIQSDAPRDVRSLSVFLLEQYGTKILNADTLHLDRTVSLRQGRNTVKLRIASIHLLPGTYRVGLWLADPVHAHR